MASFPYFCIHYGVEPHFSIHYGVVSSLVYRLRRCILILYTLWNHILISVYNTASFPHFCTHYDVVSSILYTLWHRFFTSVYITALHLTSVYITTSFPSFFIHSDVVSLLLYTLRRRFLTLRTPFLQSSGDTTGWDRRIASAALLKVSSRLASACRAQ